MASALKDVKRNITNFLKSAAALVMHSYQNYLQRDIQGKDIEELKEEMSLFKAYHDSGKAAASHLEVLMKIAKSAETDGEEEAEDEEREFQKKLVAAQNEIKEHASINNGNTRDINE